MKGKQRMSHCLDLCSVRSGCSFVFVLCLETVEKKNVLLQLSVWVAYLGCVEFDAPPPPPPQPDKPFTWCTSIGLVVLFDAPDLHPPQASHTLYLVYVNKLGCVGWHSPPTHPWPAIPFTWCMSIGLVVLGDTPHPPTPGQPYPSAGVRQ